MVVVSRAVEAVLLLDDDDDDDDDGVSSGLLVMTAENLVSSCLLLLCWLAFSLQARLSGPGRLPQVGWFKPTILGKPLSGVYITLR